MKFKVDDKVRIDIKNNRFHSWIGTIQNVDYEKMLYIVHFKTSNGGFSLCKFFETELEEIESLSKEEFKIGNTVHLKSGGPPMTVSWISTKTDENGNTRNRYLCVWFTDKQDFRDCWFSEDVIKIY